MVAATSWRIANERDTPRAEHQASKGVARSPRFTEVVLVMVVAVLVTPRAVSLSCPPSFRHTVTGSLTQGLGLRPASVRVASGRQACNTLASGFRQRCVGFPSDRHTAHASLLPSSVVSPFSIGLMIRTSPFLHRSRPWPSSVTRNHSAASFASASRILKASSPVALTTPRCSLNSA